MLDPQTLAQLNPMQMLQTQLQQQAKQLDSLFEQQRKSVSEGTTQKLSTLQKEYQIKRKYISGTAEEKHRKLSALNQQYEIAATRARGDVEPALQKLDAQKTQYAVQMAEGFKASKLKMGQIKEFMEKGVLDPATALREQLRIAGVDLPQSALQQPKPPTPEQELSRLNQTIHAIEQELQSRFKQPVDTWKPFDAKPWRYRPTGQEDFRKAEEGEIGQATQLIAKLDELRQARTGVMQQIMPDKAAQIGRVNRLTSAAARAIVGEKKPTTLANEIKKEAGQQDGPRSSREFELEVKRLAGLGRIPDARAYYDKWVSKWQ